MPKLTPNIKSPRCKRLTRVYRRDRTKWAWGFDG